MPDRSTIHQDQHEEHTMITLRLSNAKAEKYGAPEWLKVIHEANRIAGEKMFGQPTEQGKWWAGGHFEEYPDARVLLEDPYEESGTTRIVAKSERGDRVLTLAAENLGVLAPMTEPRKRRPRGSDPIPIRAFRSPDEVWGPAMEMAKAQGEPLSAALNRFLKQYAAGKAAENLGVPA